MHRDLISNTEFAALKDRLNHEILRRGTFSWWDPLTVPSVGQDRFPPLNLPEEDNQFQIDHRTYTVNAPSEGSIERTRNIYYPAQGPNPGGQVPNRRECIPSTSAAQINADEMRNLLVGLAKIQDINLFYGRDETSGLAFRDPKGIEDVIKVAEKSELNAPLHESDVEPMKNDPNGGETQIQNPDYPVEGHSVVYPMEGEFYVMPSGESDGDELSKFDGIGPQNFFDDYGAKPGDGDYHPFNRSYTPQVRRDIRDHGHDRMDLPITVVEGGVPTSSFGPNPRNPNPGSPYASRKVFGGVKGACNVACTGMCYQTCDNECSESCTTTCWDRCGNACTSTCGNVCTGCSTMCYTSCKTKCENTTGYSCVKSGAKAVEIEARGDKQGEPPVNTLKVEFYTCNGCSYSCQFYPNKKTDCWDAGCMGRCFVTCNTACSTSCFGGCVDNAPQKGDTFKTGKGRGCGGGCTLNCIGVCEGVCEGYCVQTCWHACKQQCSDNCSWTCDTKCGNGCATGCKLECGGCTNCTGSCVGQSYSRGCVGCGIEGGCTSNCQHDCNKNCIGWGCRSICGIDTEGSCEANCRLNCMGTSCTAMCSDACSGECSTCVNTCGFQCGTCSSMCSTGCGAECNITCTENCSNSCNDNCVHSCVEECGGCSNLCYSCVGMCIGVCSVKCEDGCSSCSYMCSWWCDSTCNRTCFANCFSFCITTCTGSCATFLKSETKMTVGPERGPTADGYIYKQPKNRWEERESFKIFRPIYKKPLEEVKPPIIGISFDENRNLVVNGPEGMKYTMYQSSINSGVFSIDHTTGEVTVNPHMLDAMVPENEINLDGGDGIYLIAIDPIDGVEVANEDIEYKVPFGFAVHDPIRSDEGKLIIIVERDPFLHIDLREEDHDGEDIRSILQTD